MKKENRTAYMILGLLSHEELTGYDIKARMDSALSMFWSAGYGQIYPTLKQLHAEGHVVKRTDQKHDKMERIAYAITDSGREQLKAWLALPAKEEVVKYEILLKLFFGSLVETEANLATIHAFKDRHVEPLNLLNTYEKQLLSVQGESLDHLYYLLTVKFGQKIYSAYMEWADEAIALLEHSNALKGDSHEA